MQSRKPSRRPRGTGSVFEKYGSWYGQWRVNGELVARKLGPVRKPRTAEGLTQEMAEQRLREQIAKVKTPPPRVRERMAIKDVCEARIEALKLAGRKQNTTENYESDLRVHFEPHFGRTPVTKITADDVERFKTNKLRGGLSPKTVRNQLNHLNACFEFAIRKGWVAPGGNPVAGVDRPASARRTKEIRFLTPEQLDELLRVGAEAVDRCVHGTRTLERAVKVRQLRDEGLEWKVIGIALGCSPATAIYLSRCSPENVERDLLALTDRVLWLTAARTGLRQGELLELPWRHVDWIGATIRVHRNTSAEGTVKSDDSFRAVPMSEVVAQELERHFQRSEFQGDDNLVFCHPITGDRLDRSAVTRRLQAALKTAKLPDLTFHELRHTFGTTMAAAGVPMRDLMEWMGHADSKTTQLYTHYAPRRSEAAVIDAAFSSIKPSIKLHTTQDNSDPLKPPKQRARN